MRTLLASVAVWVAAPALAADPVKIETVHAEKGFIDDPIALTADGKAVAYILTDGATFAELRIAGVGGKEAPATMPYPSITPERMDFLDGERLLVVERNPETRLARAQVFTRKGPAKDKLGPADDIVLATVAGTPAIVTYVRSVKGKAVTHTLTAYKRADLKQVSRRVLAEGADGRVTVAGVPMKLLFFEENYTQMIGQKEGVYDAKHDIRKPDLEATVDVFAGKLTGEREIKDLVKFAELAKLRANHQNESDFLQFSDDLKQLLLVDRDDATNAVTTPRPQGKYDPQTLRYQPTGERELVFSLTVDPVNPEAVAAKKADKDWIDLYRLDTKTRALTDLGRIDGNKRPSKWRLSGARIAVIRGHKGFGRGGAEMDLFDVVALPQPKPEPKTEPKAEPGKPEPAKPEPKAEPKKAEPAKVEAKSAKPEATKK